MINSLLTGGENEAVEGIYRLSNLLEASSESAVYETEFGEPAQAALIQLMRGDTADAERRLSRWRQAMALSHPNLIRLHAAGTSVLGGVPVIYLVMERADESLAGVLGERALSESETREMLEPLLSVLSYLHKNGYAHGRLQASNILAAGDTLKLSSEQVEPIGEGGAPAEDMRELGQVLVQALTREIPNVGHESEPEILREVPEPFRRIARHCLDPDPQKRWTTEEAMADFHAQTERPAQGIREPVPQRHRDIRADVGRAGIASPDTAESNQRKWVYVAVAALLVLAVSAGIWKSTGSHAAVAPALQVANAPAPISARSVDVPEPEIPRPAVSAPQPAPAKKPVARPAAGRRSDGWAVVVAAYGAHDAAAKRAREMAKKWRRFKVDIFEPASEKARHLVVLGTNLTEDQAEALRQRAIAAGLPRDAYIKRFAAPQE